MERCNLVENEQCTRNQIDEKQHGDDGQQEGVHVDQIEDLQLQRNQQPNQGEQPQKTGAAVQNAQGAQHGQQVQFRATNSQQNWMDLLKWPIKCSVRRGGVQLGNSQSAILIANITLFFLQNAVPDHLQLVHVECLQSISQILKTSHNYLILLTHGLLNFPHCSNRSAVPSNFINSR